MLSCCLALLSDAVVPDLVVRRSIAVDLYGQKLTYTKVYLFNYILVIKLISNIIRNFNTCIYASVVYIIFIYYEMFAA